MSATAPHVAVIGAGIAGLVAARGLVEAGIAVSLFEKSRGAGGRCATRRSELGPFHHGVASFTAHSPAFCEEVLRWQARGWVQPGPDDGQPRRWSGEPTMNALARRLAEGLNLHTQHTVQAPQRTPDGRWALTTAEHGPWPHSCDALLLAVPAEQARPLCAASLPLQQALAGVHSQPCWTLMLGWPAGAAPATGPGPAASSTAGAEDGVLAEVVDVSRLPAEAANRADPASSPATRWVLHASAAWSTTHLELPAAEATQRLLQALAAWPGVGAFPAPTHVAAHRWRYAQVAAPAAAACGWDAALRLGSCGDAWGGALPGASALDGVERAWLSGRALATATRAALQA